MTAEKLPLLVRVRPRSLRAQALLYLLLPTFLLLVGLSVVGFFIVRNALLNQWGQTAVATLQQTAHLVDMRLHGSKELLRLLQSNTYNIKNRDFFDTVVQRLLELDSVLEVRVDWPQDEESQVDGQSMVMHGMHSGKRFHLDSFKTSSPTFDEQADSEVVTLVSLFLNEQRQPIGRVEIVFSFNVLVAQIQSARWWHSNRAYLLNGDGDVLASTSDDEDLEHQFPRRYFGGLGSFESRTLEAINSQDSGTVFADGFPPREVSGFYRLREMPWVIVIISPGELVLEPLIRFRNLYNLCFAGAIFLILLFILQATGGVTARITMISRAADELAAGRFQPPLPEKGTDEVGELTRNFNRMSVQLEQRLNMKKAINIAREIQQNLLPDKLFHRDCVEIAGTSRYCDETGGDYYDLLTFNEDENRVGVAIGDVVGHGIGAALLMTTIRALLRCRLAMGGAIEATISDVNRLLCVDTLKSGSFITLFYLEVDILQKKIRWVRGGHEPALLYLVRQCRFVDLRGDGLALGVDENWMFTENIIDTSGEEAIICLATDGVYDLRNDAGQVYGRARLQRGLARYADRSPQEILSKVLAEIELFRGEAPVGDDITLVVIKIGEHETRQSESAGERAVSSFAESPMAETGEVVS